jgi:alpha-glucosidase (family GH31 glycosyl hydrolase)
MPVFVRAGGIVTTRSDNVPNDSQSPLDKVSATVVPGASGVFSLYEDDGTTSHSGRTATTRIRYTEHEDTHLLKIAPAKGTFPGQVSRRTWTVSFLGVGEPPSQVSAAGTRLTRSAWHWDADTHVLRITTPAHSIRAATAIAYK